MSHDLKQVRQTVTKRVRFSAAHHYYREEWTVEKNEAVFGLCANQAGHGHNYCLDVTVSGPLHRDTGMVVNFDSLLPVLEKAVVQPLDHQYLNTQVDFFKTHIPTLENIARFIWLQLAKPIESLAALECKLESIRVFEHDDLYVEYQGRTHSVSLP